MPVGNANAPFLNVNSFVAEEAEVSSHELRPTPIARSPFVSVYEFAEGESEYDEPLREAYSSVVAELYDEEFDESLFELLTEGRNLHQDHVASGHSLDEADQIVTLHFSQLIRESESMVDAMAREFGTREHGGGIESEMDTFVERYAPSATLPPSFEDFLGKLAKKIGKGIKKAAGTALQGIKKLALGPILAQIKAIFPKLLKPVLQKAIGRIPAELRPAAQKLAERLGLAAPAPPPVAPAPLDTPGTPAEGAPVGAPSAPVPPEDVGSPVQAGAGPDVTEMQLDFNQQLVEALFAEDEVELNLEVARLTSASDVAAVPVFTDLDRARERFTHELQNLKQGESPTPYVENFLPAILPALKIATKVIGRKRIINVAAPIIGKLISKIVGPQLAPALSRVIVDAGLKLFSLELSDQEKSNIAASSVVATVEETMSRIASLPEHILENQDLLEGFTLEAFEQAAAANLPALFSGATYKKRPDLLEGGVNAAWPMFPSGRPRYKRCTRSFKVKVTPHMAEEVESFDGSPLSDYLQDQLGFPEGAEVEAEVYLYETLPGATIGDIARSESETPGLGASDEATIAQFQALTPEAAGILLGKPGLGRKLPPSVDRRNLPAGLRLYHLATAARPLTVAGAGRLRVRRMAHIKVTLDCTRDQIRVCIFLSEVKAQKLAVQLRKQAHAGSLTVGLHKFLRRRLGPILKGARRRRLRIVQAGIVPGPALDAVMDRLPNLVPPPFIAKVEEWLLQGFAEFIKTNTQKFLSASEDPADGVTLVFTIEHPPGLKELCQSLFEKRSPSPSVAGSVGKGSSPIVRVEALPGHKCD